MNGADMGTGFGVEGRVEVCGCVEGCGVWWVLVR